jgi:hypothetical protein
MFLPKEGRRGKRGKVGRNELSLFLSRSLSLSLFFFFFLRNKFSFFPSFAPFSFRPFSSLSLLRQVGDVITHVDQRNVEKENLETVRSLILGPPGTIVDLQFRRKGGEGEREKGRNWEKWKERNWGKRKTERRTAM